MMCREPRAKIVDRVPPGLYHAPANIPGDERGWRMRINTKPSEPGQTFVWTMTALPSGGAATSTILMHDPVAPCELVPDTRRVDIERGRPATREGGPLEHVTEERLQENPVRR